LGMRVTAEHQENLTNSVVMTENLEAISGVVAYP